MLVILLLELRRSELALLPVDNIGAPFGIDTSNA
jgi:hypothetical protein